MTDQSTRDNPLPNDLPPPPVPLGLQEMLKDYPEHIKTLQEDLNKVVSKPHPGVPLLEVAIWMLEGALETFISEARDELDSAKASGDVEAIERAKQKEFLMRDCRGSPGAWKDENLMAYFGFPIQADRYDA